MIVAEDFQFGNKMKFNPVNKIHLCALVLCLCVSSTLQYSIVYQTYDNHTTTLTDVYGASSMSEANCQHQCSQDSRCKSFVIFEDDKGNTTCGFSETREYFPAVNCTVCSVHLKECKSESVTYTKFLHGYIGSQQYANFDSLNYNHCEKTCTSDPLCNGFIHNSVTSHCRLTASSSEIPYSENNDFSFYRKECPSGCSIYGEYFVNTSNTFFNTFENTTRKECEYLCNNISECRGYAGDDLNQICGLSYSSQNGHLENCTACTNLAKQCPVGKYTVPAKRCSSTTYIDFGTHYESSATYKTFNSSSLVLCQTECNNDPECSGIGFNSLTQICDLSKSIFPRESFCSYCSFSARECSDSSLDYFVQCSSNFLEYGANLTLTSDYFNVSGVSLSTCQQLCSNDSSCVSFHHQQNTSECRLSKSSSSVSTICVSCTYQTKQCSQGCTSVSYTLFEFGHVASSVRTDFAGQAMTYQNCQEACSSDPLCFGFSHRADGLHCILSGSKDPAWNPSCLNCTFSQKICSTVTTTPSKGSCGGCFCRKTNQSVDELLLWRKQELTVNTEGLSSTTRKLNCAEDSRTSSKVIGAIGVLILMLVITLLILPDLCSLISFIMKKVQEHKKPIVIQL